MRTIDADALKKEFPKDTDWEYPTNTNEYVCEKIDAQPTVQPETNCSEIPNNSDIISRPAAIRWVKQECNPYGKPTLDFESGKRVMEHLERMPSAQPETAKRIVGKSRDGMTLWYQCDMCNEPVDAQDNYCRRCGRRLIDETD